MTTDTVTYAVELDEDEAKFLYELLARRPRNEYESHGIWTKLRIALGED